MKLVSKFQEIQFTHILYEKVDLLRKIIKQQ